MLTVAAGAEPAVITTSKLAPMGVGMAVGTTIMRDFPGHRSTLVALFAFESGMQTYQREVGIAVIEIGHGYIVPAACPVTARTVQSELALVFVLVAGGAIVETKARVLPITGGRGRIRLGHQRVTSGAIDLPVTAGQSKAGAVMIERSHRFETVVSVALKAVRAELAAMLIGVTTQTGSVQPKICSRKVQIGTGRCRRLP